MCKQASGSSGNFSWRHMQTGSRYPPKPEVVITRRREDISTWSQRLRHIFLSCPFHLHLRQPRLTMENTIRCKPEVETASQTGSRPTINLATKTDIDAMSVSLPMFLWARFSRVYIPTSPDAFFTQKLQDGGRIPEVVISLRRKMVSLLSQQLRHSFRSLPVHLHSTLASTPSDYGKHYQVQTGSSNNLATETDVDAIAVAIPMFLGASFSLVYKPTSPDAATLHSPRNTKIADGYRSPDVVITLGQKPASTWSQCSVDERGRG